MNSGDDPQGHGWVAEETAQYRTVDQEPAAS